jgi:hypothetical protein
MLPASDATFCAGGALVFHRTDLACRAPIDARGEIGLLRIGGGKSGARRQGSDGHPHRADRRLLAETALGLGGGGIGSGGKGRDTDVLAGDQIGAAIIAGIGNDFDRFKAKRLLRLHRHVRQLPAINDLVGDLRGDDEMMLGSDSRLNIIADDAKRDPGLR